MSTVRPTQSDIPTSVPSSTISLTQSIEKHNGSIVSGKSNYQAWKLRIVLIQKEKRLLTAIENELDERNVKDLARDNGAFIITLNVRDWQITHIQKCATAKVPWEALRKVHQGIGGSGHMVFMQLL